jgi:hypothetical protein
VKLEAYRALTVSPEIRGHSGWLHAELIGDPRMVTIDELEQTNTNKQTSLLLEGDHRLLWDLAGVLPW